MTMTAQGIIIRITDKFLDLSDGVSYSAWTPLVAYEDVSQGDEVSFIYLDKEGRGGKVYHNIQGTVALVRKGDTATSSVTAVATSPTRFERKEKPGDPPLHVSRSISRAVALKAAIEFLAAQVSCGAIKSFTHDDAISVAKVFEGYLTGDDDMSKAEELVEEGDSTSEKLLEELHKSAA